MESIDYIETVNGVDIWHRGGGVTVEVEHKPAPTIVIDAGVEQRHRAWVERQGWKTAEQSAIEAAEGSE